MQFARQQVEQEAAILRQPEVTQPTRPVTVNGQLVVPRCR